MSVRRPLASLALFAVAIVSWAPESAEAGPLLDWLFGRYRTQPAYPVGVPVPIGGGANLPYAGNPAGGYAASYGNYYGSMMPVIGPSGYGYSAAQPMGVAAAVAPSIMSYVPDYRTSQYRAPVTYYRPLMTTDPNSGSQVVALAPCTSYEYQTQRIPTFGYNGVMGSYSTPPVQPAPPSLPTYTLPSGGVPLAAGGSAAILPPNSNAYAMGYGGYAPLQTMPYSSPSYSSGYGSGYSSNYRAFSPQQPTLTAPPSGTYPTQQFSTTPGYYGSVSGGSAGGSAYTGGSTGTYIAPNYTPGLVAPQSPLNSPSIQFPATPPATQYQVNPYPVAPYPGTVPNAHPTMPVPSFPGTSFPGSGNVFPAPDPAGDVPPTLPPSSTNASSIRPHLRAIVRQPLANNTPTNNNAPQLEQSQSKSEAARQSQSPSMDPIPAPTDLEHQPRWNPGLLNEQDRTALRPIAPNSSHFAGQSKTIQWASFRSEVASHETPVENASQSSGLRAIVTPPAKLDSVQVTAPSAPRRAAQYHTGGWRAAK